MSTIWSFDHLENNHTLYREKDCIKFCKSLREYTQNIIDFEINKNITINKRRTKIASRCKKLLYLWKKNLKKVC